MAYAENTEVAVEKSIQEIVTLIKRAGAERIAQVEEPDGFAIQYFLNDRMLRFRVRWVPYQDIPKRDGRNVLRSFEQLQKIAAQKAKQRARALLLVIKAKLESVESGVETFEEAFLANVVMPDGKTVGDYALPAIADSYATGKMPALALLPPPPES